VLWWLFRQPGSGAFIADVRQLLRWLSKEKQAEDWHLEREAERQAKGRGEISNG
jgi:hypothetical protein